MHTLHVKMRRVLLLLLQVTVVCENAYRSTATSEECMLRMGVVVDGHSREGKELLVAMEMAVNDFFPSSSDCNSSEQLVVRNENARESPAMALSVAAGLIAKEKLVSIFVGTKLTKLFEESALVSATEDTKRILKDSIIFSFFPSSSLMVSSTHMPYYIEMSNHLGSRIRILAAIVGHLKWRKVTVVYESRHDGFSVDQGHLNFLTEELRMVGSQVEGQMALPAYSSAVDVEKIIEVKLGKLKENGSNMFLITQCSLELGILLFKKANQMRMVDDGHVWIVSDEIGDLLDSVNSTVINDMQGVIALKAKVEENRPNFSEFKRRFRRNYGAKFPTEEEHSSPNINALRAYDAAWAIFKAKEKLLMSNLHVNSSNLFDAMMSSRFEGVTGNISFRKNELVDRSQFQVVDVAGRSYRVLSRRVEAGGPIYWLDGMRDVLSRRTTGSLSKRLKIGIPNSLFPPFVNVQNVKHHTFVSGFSIQVFEAAWKLLPYDLQYDFVPFRGTYTELVEAVYSKKFDGAAGDIEIMADRLRKVDFTLPYIPSGLAMVVPEKHSKFKATWLLYIFTDDMWYIIICMHLSISLAAALIELSVNRRIVGIGGFTALWITILTYTEEPLESVLARCVRVPWMLVIAILVSCFNASLTSTMTVSRIKPLVTDLESLKRTNATVGCNGNSFIVNYLKDVALLKPENIKFINATRDYIDAFNKREIQAAFFVEPHSKVFLKKFCKGFVSSGTPDHLGGFGFVFPKNSSLTYYMSSAILDLMENGEINRLEKGMLDSIECIASMSDEEVKRIDGSPFTSLLLLSAAVGGLGFVAVVVRCAFTLFFVRSFRNSIARIRKNVRLYRISDFFVLPS